MYNICIVDDGITHNHVYDISCCKNFLIKLFVYTNVLTVGKTTTEVKVWVINVQEENSVVKFPHFRQNSLVISARVLE